MHTVCLIPGDGIGPELTEATRRCVEATGVPIRWEVVEAGEAARLKTGSPLPEPVLAAIRRATVAIKGPITTPIGTGMRSVNVALRHALDLYACVRPCRWMEGVSAPHRGVDLVIIRENSEDLYAGIEFDDGTPEVQELIRWIEAHQPKKIRPDSAISIKPISKTASARIVRYAFEYAVAHGRRTVTAITKANIMKFTDGLFLEAAREVAKEYQGRIEFDERLVDALCMQLVQRPQQFDVLVLPNLYGDIVSDLCAGLVGGLGVAPGANIGPDVAVFEPVHGSAPKYAGQNKANPTAEILSAVLMLRHLGEPAAADRLEQAVQAVIREGKQVTYDLKPRRDDPTAVGTSQMADAIIEHLRVGHFI
ncbi:MAG: isocitrate dehydrogenase [Omnitrophica WOR_2 bacterium RIFCSPHIGHO2_02_FULL_68_15]|nr:MAG: isocitrate dehydrogenase [Omnitrophica WOR_2 bacterium RIFCSPHIGHO2_02_FULL_68_15]